MVSAAPLSDFEEYEHLKKKVIEQKKLPGEVSPADLYKLAVLMSRWAATAHLPMCLLCRESNKKLQKGHIYPNSVLETLEKKGEQRYTDIFRGAEWQGASKCAYHVFCGDCEKIFQQGENYFNKKFFASFCENVGGQHKISVTETRSESSFPWLYYCLISIIWRALCFVPKIKDDGTCIEVLEYLRSYLLDWKKVEIDRVKLFLFAPNCEVDKKLEAGSEVNKVFFYEWAFFTTELLKMCQNPNETNKFLSGWLFLGPLHVFMLYSEDNFAFMEGYKTFEEWKENSSLTPETNEFTIPDKEGRIFPVDFCDKIIELGALVASVKARQPSADQNYNNGSRVLDAVFGHWLPKDISYDRVRDRFSFNTNMFVEKDQRELKMKIVKAERKANKEQILFVVVQGVVNGTGELAMGLHVNADGTVEFMKGVNVPKRAFGWNSNDPPFKNTIEGLLRDLPAVTPSAEPKEEQSNSDVSK